MLRFAPTRIVVSRFVRFLGTKSKIAAGIALIVLTSLVLGCSSSHSSLATQPVPNIAGPWEFIATSSTGSMTGIEVQLTEGQTLQNGVQVPNGQIAADSAQLTFISLTPMANQTNNISSFGGSCGATATTLNSLSGMITVGQSIDFTFTANGNVFNVNGTLSTPGSLFNGTYTPQAGNTCSDPGGTISGLPVSIPAGQYAGEMCSPSETSCSDFDDNVNATVTFKSGQITLNLQLSGADNTSLTVTGPVNGAAFSVLGTYQGSSVTYYGYFEAVYEASSGANVQGLYLVNAADPCFANPGATCSTATIITRTL